MKLLNFKVNAIPRRIASSAERDFRIRRIFFYEKNNVSSEILDFNCWMFYLP